MAATEASSTTENSEFRNIRWAINATTNWCPSDSEFSYLVNTYVPEPEERNRITRYRFEKDRKASLLGRLLIRKLVSQTWRAFDPTTPDSFYYDVKISRTPEGKPYLVRSPFVLLIAMRKLFIVYRRSDGKASPRPKGLSRWNFNISHHGDWVVIASHTDVCIIQFWKSYQGCWADECFASETHRCRRVESRSVWQRQGSYIIWLLTTKKPLTQVTWKSVTNFFSSFTEQFTDREWRSIRRQRLESERLEQFYRFWTLKESYTKVQSQR